MINESEWQDVESFNPIEPRQAEGIPGWIGRQLSRSGSRALESVLGIPAASYELLQSASSAIPESVKNALSQGINVNPLISMIPTITQAIGSIAPSQQQIRETIKGQVPEGYLEPQNMGEDLADEIVSDFATLMVPIGGAISPLKAAGISGLSNISSFLTKKLGASEKTQAGVKMGTALLSSLGMGPSLKNKAEQLYQTAREAIVPGEKVSAKPLTNLTNKITREYTSKGLSKSAGKADVEYVIQEINNFIKDGEIGLDDLWEIKKDMRDVGEKIGFRTRGGKELTQLSHEMDKLLKSTPNKAFSQALQAADELYSGAKRGEAITDYLKDTLKNKYSAGSILYGIISHPTSVLKIGGSITGGKKVYDILNNIIRFPHIRNEYRAMLSAAAKENAPLLIKHAKKLESNLEKYIPKEEIVENEWKEI